MDKKDHIKKIVEALQDEGYESISEQENPKTASNQQNNYSFSIKTKNHTNPNESKMTVIKYDHIEKLISTAEINDQIPIYILSIWIEEKNKGYIAIINARNIEEDFKRVQLGYSVNFKDLEDSNNFSHTTIHKFNDSYQNRYSSIAYDISKIKNYSNLKRTEIEQLINARLGQGKFRKKLINLFNGRCLITGCKIETLLIASHIKPWAKSSNDERLDEYNGLLLTPTFDALFDKGFISFDKNGILIVAKSIPQKQKEILGIQNSIKISLSEENHIYMKFHRENVFKG